MMFLKLGSAKCLLCQLLPRIRKGVRRGVRSLLGLGLELAVLRHGFAGHGKG
ncbi:unnamed protein product, partial [Prorocentrum cordatum]